MPRMTPTRRERKKRKKEVALAKAIRPLDNQEPAPVVEVIGKRRRKSRRELEEVPE